MRLWNDFKEWAWSIDLIVLKVITRLVDGSRFDEFKAKYGETLVTGEKFWSAILFLWSYIHDAIVFKDSLEFLDSPLE